MERLQLEYYYTHLFVSVVFSERWEVKGRQPQNILSVWLGLVKHLIFRWETIPSCWQCYGGKTTPYLFGRKLNVAHG